MPLWVIILYFNDPAENYGQHRREKGYWKSAHTDTFLVIFQTSCNFNRAA
jgi:hypothetical protein